MKSTLYVLLFCLWLTPTFGQQKKPTASKKNTSTPKKAVVKPSTPPQNVTTQSTNVKAVEQPETKTTQKQIIVTPPPPKEEVLTPEMQRQRYEDALRREREERGAKEVQPIPRKTPKTKVEKKIKPQKEKKVAPKEIVAQSTNPFTWGLKGGYTMNTLTTTGKASVNKGWLSAYQAGIFTHIPLSKVVAIQTELNFSKRGLQYTYINDFEKLDMTYIELPLLLKYQTQGRRASLFVYGGVYAAYWLKGTLKSRSNGIENEVLYPFDNDTSDGYADNRIDYGAMVGIGTKIKLGHGGIILDARYTYGLADISKLSSQPANYSPSNHRIIGVSIGYSFKF